MKCPTCQSFLLSEDVNIQKDIAMCRNCNKVYSISQELIDQSTAGRSEVQLVQELENFDISNPPDQKTWVKQTAQGISIGASSKSSMAYFFLIFLVVFGGISGIVFSVFLFSGQLEGEMILFFIPFFLVDLIMIGLFIFMFFGKVEVMIDRYQGEVFVGAFNWGWRSAFDVKEVEKIVEDYSNVTMNNVRKKHIVIHTAKGPISFGSTLKDARRRFIYLALNKYFYQLNQKLGRS
ncbi:MAG: hypothetical protein ACPGJS_00170 [Flammeovirgaceae bacterium]